MTIDWQSLDPRATAEAAGFLAAGVVLGLVHFSALWRNARQLAEGAGWRQTAALAVARFALLILSLVLASRQGAPALIAVTAGLLVGRAVVMRRVGRRLA